MVRIKTELLPVLCVEDWVNKTNSSLEKAGYEITNVSVLPSDSLGTVFVVITYSGSDVKLSKSDAGGHKCSSCSSCSKEVEKSECNQKKGLAPGNSKEPTHEEAGTMTGLMREMGLMRGFGFPFY